MATVNWAASAVSEGDVLTTELNDLADDARTDVGTEFDNGTNKDTHAVLELDINFGSSPTDSLPLFNFYLIKAIDGTNYANGSDNVDPGYETKVAEVSLNAVATAQKKSTIIFEIPPCKFKIIAENKTGVVAPASGSTVGLYTMNLGSV